MPRTKSPLRYPGGKTQLAEFTKKLIALNEIENTIYIEPYSGGFGIGIELLLSNQVERVVINDYDKSIYSIWYSIIHHTEKLINLIENTSISIENWYEQKEIHKKYKNYRNSLENGFSTLFLNRTNRSGIINAGPIGGYDQSGKYKLDCRFNKIDIINKIRRISQEAHRIDLFQKDAVKLVDIIKNKYNPDNTFIFFDPPYYVQGKNLYTNFYNHNDHLKLAKKINELDNYYWITTYDYEPQIQEIYTTYTNSQNHKYELNYSAQTKKRATEFIFASPITQLNSFDKVKLT